MKATVRQATTDDAAEVGRLLDDFNTEFGDPTPGPAVLAERVRRLLAEEEIAVLLGGEGPDAVAVISFRPSVWSDDLDAYLQELYVAPAVRGKGLGRAMIDEVIALARGAGADHLDLNTSDGDTAAIGLYESSGFTNREGAPDGPAMRYYEREL
jgi:ribosomal protein S18 acetylase RimI-like enzyme